MGGISEEGVLWLENQMKAENHKILLQIHNCWRLFWCSTYHENHRLQLQLRSGFCKLWLCCKMNVRVKPKVKWHWYGEKLVQLCKRKLDFVVTLDDVIGVDNVAIIVEATRDEFVSEVLIERHGAIWWCHDIRRTGRKWQYWRWKYHYSYGIIQHDMNCWVLCSDQQILYGFVLGMNKILQQFAKKSLL